MCVCVSVISPFPDAPVRSIPNPYKVSVVLLFRGKPQIPGLEEMTQLLRVSIALAEDQYPHTDMHITEFKINLLYTKVF